MSNQHVSLIFKSLGDPTRLGIFQTLRSCAADSSVVVDEEGQVRPAGSLSVGEVCCRIGGSGSTISHHLKELRLAGLIRMEKRGRWIYCSVVPEALAEVQSFLAEPCCAEPSGCCPVP
jgi:ArsR family transcriptional regulator